MRVAIVFNHPYEKSYCAALLQAVCEGLKTAQHEVDIIHLDQDGFNPVMTAADLKAFRDKKPVDAQALAYAERIQEADYLVFIFPIWWELMPAMMKGFVDKVIFPGVAYDYRDASNTLMRPRWTKLKGVSIITTMNTPRWLYYLLFGDAIKKAMILGTFWKMGYKNLRWISYNQVKMVSQEKRTRWLDKLRARFAKLA